MSWKIKFFFLFALLIACIIVGRHGGSGDFKVLYGAVKAACSGNSSGIYSRDQYFPLFYPYPPSSVFFFSFLCPFEDRAAIYVNLVFHTFSYLLFWGMLWKLYPIFSRREFGWGWFWVWVISINPIHSNFMGQNINLPLAALLFSAQWALFHSNRVLRKVGACLSSLGIFLKIFPAFVVVYHLIVSDKKNRYWILLSSALLAALPLVVFGAVDGIKVYRGFFINLTQYGEVNSIVENLGILCLPSLLVTWLTPLFGSTRIPFLITFGIQAALATTLFFFLFTRASRLTASGLQTHCWALVLALMTLFNPGSRQDYFMFYVPAFASTFQLWFEGKLTQTAKWAIIVSVALVAFTTQLTLGRDLARLVHGWRIPVIGLVGLCWVLASTIFQLIASGHLPTNKSNGNIQLS